MRRVEEEDVREIVRELNIEEILERSFLITGATGSLGRYPTLTLCTLFSENRKRAGKVIVLGRNREKTKSIFEEFWNEPFFTYIEGDVESFKEYEGDIDYIIHAACMSNTAYFHSNPVEIASANMIGTYNLLNLAKEKKVKGFLFFSSGAVFGGDVPDDFSYAGIDPQDHVNCYAMSKAAGENLCACFHKEYGLPVKIVRIGFTYGPHIDINDGHLYSDFVKAIVERKTLEIRGDGQRTIGLCYVTDAVRAFFLILMKGKDNTPYTMRNFKEPLTIEEIARMLTEEVFSDRGLTYRCAVPGTHKEHTGLRKPELLCELGWEPVVSVAEGFRRTVECIENKR